MQKVKRKKNILLILKTPPPYGGGEIRALALHDYVKSKKSYHVMRISSVRRNKASQKKFEHWKLLELLKHIFQFLVLLIRLRPKMLFLSLPKSFFAFGRDSLFIWIAVLFRIAVFTEVAGQSLYFLEGNKRIRKWYGRLVLKRIECMRLLSTSIKDKFAMYGVRNTVVSDNGVYVPEKHKYRIESEDGFVNILFVGTLSPEKGFDLLVKSIYHLSEKQHPVRLHSIGEWISDEFRKSIQDYINRNCLSSRVSVHGNQFEGKKWNIYQQSQIFCLPSLDEGQPLVLLEALGCGLPIVTSHVGAIPETVKNGVNGIIVPPGSIEDLEGGLEKLVKDPYLRKQISQNNNRLYQKRFTLRSYLRNQIALFQTSLEKSSRPQGQFFCREKYDVRKI
jgi:glycosyltransferase involved in cell wall biosynthesis